MEDKVEMTQHNCIGDTGTFGASRRILPSATGARQKCAEREGRIALALTVIDTSLRDCGLTLGHVSNSVNLSRSCLSRLFRDCLGLGFRDYLRGRRLDLAKELITSTSLSIKEVSSRVGYKHASDLSSDFKARFGCTPRSLRGGQSM